MSRTPPVSDSSWIPWSHIVCAFLEEEPKNWEEIVSWVKSENLNLDFMRHAFAWCEEKGMAHTTYSTKGLVWCKGNRDARLDHKHTGETEE